MAQDNDLRDELARLNGIQFFGQASPAAFLLELHSRNARLGRSLARIAVLDANHELREMAALLILTIARDGGVPRPVRRPLLRETGEALLRMFRDPAHDDTQKYLAPPLLELCGVRLSRDDMERHFRDYPAIVKKMSAERFGSLPASVGSVADLLAGIGLLDADEPADVTETTLGSALTAGEDALGANPPLGAAVLLVTCAMAHEAGIGGEPIEEALDRAAGTGTPVAAFLLNELAGWPNGAELASRAGRLLERVARPGVAPAPLEIGEFVRGSVSIVDGVGSQSLSISFRSPVGGHPEEADDLDLLSVLINEDSGIKDVFAAFGEGAGLEAQMKDMEESEGIESFPCDLALARALLAEALAVHSDARTSPPGRWLLFRSMLGAEPIAASRRELDLSAFDLGSLPADAGLLEGTGSLAGESPFEDWFHASDEAYRFIEKQVKKPALSRYAAGEDPPADLVREFNELHAARDRDRIIHRLAVHLDLAARSGRAGTPASRRIARLYKALSSEVVPWADIPFVSALGAEAVRCICGNLAEGYRTQQEANDAAERASGDHGAFEFGSEFEDEDDDEID